MLVTFYKWFKKGRSPKSTMIETTKDYFSDGDEYINAKNGWEKLPDKYIELVVKENEDVKVPR